MARLPIRSFFGIGSEPARSVQAGVWRRPPPGAPLLLYGPGLCEINHQTTVDYLHIVVVYICLRHYTHLGAQLPHPLHFAMPFQSDIDASSPALWDIIPNDVKNIIASYVPARVVLRALEARPTTAPVPVFPASSPLITTEDNEKANQQTLLDVERYFVPRNIVRFCGDATPDVLTLLQKSPTPRFSRLRLRIAHASQLCLPMFQSILSRVDKLELNFVELNRASVVARIVDLIGIGCKKLRIHLMPREGLVVDAVVRALSRLHSLRYFSYTKVSHYYTGPEESLESVLAKCVTKVNLARFKAGLRWLWVIRETRGCEIGHRESLAAVINTLPDHMTECKDVAKTHKVSNVKQYGALRSIGMHRYDVSRFATRSYLDEAITREHALDLLKTFEEFASGPCDDVHPSFPVNFLSYVCTALPDQVDRVAATLIQNARRVELSDYVTPFLAVYPPTAEALFANLNAMLIRLLYTTEDFPLALLADCRTGTWPALVAHWREETADIRRNPSWCEARFAGLVSVAADRINYRYMTLPQGTSPQCAEDIQAWFSEFIALLIEHPDFNGPETREVAKMDEIVLSDAGSYCLEDVDPMTWVWKEKATVKKRKTIDNLLQECQAKRRKLE